MIGILRYLLYIIEYKNGKFSSDLDDRLGGTTHTQKPNKRNTIIIATN